MKTVGDAMLLRDHIINMLEQADVEHEDEELKKRLMTGCWVQFFNIITIAAVTIVKAIQL